MIIRKYEDKYKDGTINLILHIQNDEAKINLSLEEQPDLKDIDNYYKNKGGNFWIATDNEEVIGTIGVIKREKDYGILKKFFVDSNCRGEKVGYSLYVELLKYCAENNFKYLLLDTPSVATKSQEFYERNGFKRVTSKDIEIEYSYPDRNSYLYLKVL